MTKATLLGQHSDITGRRFGRLVAMSRLPILQANGRTMSLWECICDCGRRVTIRLSNLSSGNTQSCGCLYKEAMAAQRAKFARRNFPSEYNTWCNMRARCANPKNRSYPDYGGRGITVCDRWINSFENFILDVGTKPSPIHQLDRINNNGNYEPGNVRWATPLVQSRNRRTNTMITMNGKTQCIEDWSIETGINAETIRGRIRLLGWDPIKAITTPKRGTDNNSSPDKAT